jgi:WD40 repeat protein
LSADNKILASASDKGLYLWDTTRRELINSFEGASRVAFSPDSSLLASISMDGVLRIREAISSDLLFEIEGFTSFGKATFHDDFIVSTYIINGGGISVHQLAEAHNNFYYFANIEVRRSITIRDITTGEIIRKFKLPEGIRLLSIALSPDNTKIASSWTVAGNRKVVAVFDVLTGEQLHVIRGDDPIAFSEDGSLLIIGSGNKTIIWDLEAGESLSLEPDSFPEKFVRKSNASPDGSVWAIAGNRSISLQSIQGIEVSLKGHTRPIYDLAFSADGKFLYSSSYDGTIIIWDIEKILHQP